MPDMTKHPVQIARILVPVVCFTFGWWVTSVHADDVPEPYGLDSHWPQPWQEAFEQRRRSTIAALSGSERYGNKLFDNERYSYPRAMFDLLAGREEPAIAFLQAGDDRTDWHRMTEGIDFFACFTLLYQTRKYFHFQDYFPRGYRQRMYRAANLWTQQDPYLRESPVYHGNARPDAAPLLPGAGPWSPENQNSWVDVRSSDAMRAMRQTSVYLFAETTGNDAVRDLYRQRITDYVRSLYHTGSGAWDSPDDLGWIFCAYLNLYDFADDPHMQLLARAALDWISATVAAKYYHGMSAGPASLDNNSPYPFGGITTSLLALYFTEGERLEHEPPLEAIHVVTSDYRPPVAIVHLARKQIDTPMMLLASKPAVITNHPPTEAPSQTFDQPDEPAFYETLTLGRRYMLGSLARGVGVRADRVNAMKLLVHDDRQGVGLFTASATNLLQDVLIQQPGEQFAQLDNMLICLTNAANAPFTFLLPQQARVQQRNDGWLIRLPQIWIMLYPINLGTFQPADVPAFLQQDWQSPRMMVAQGEGNFVGYALVVHEIPQDHADVTIRLEDYQLDPDQINRGIVTLRRANGDDLRLAHQPDALPLIDRGDQRHDWSQHRALYQPARDDAAAPIQLGWRQGTLIVEAGGVRFEQTSPTRSEE